MTISLIHDFVSPKSDGSDTTLIQPSNWNAEHALEQATATLLGRKTAATGATEEIPLWHYATVAEATAASIPVALERVYVASYSTTTDKGGAWYRRQGSNPAHNLKFQDALSAWWAHDEPELWIEQAGGMGDGSTNDTTALTNAFAYCSLYRKPLRLGIGTWTTTTTLTATSGFSIIGTGMGDDAASATQPSTFPCNITWTTAAPTANTITAASKANPCVITYGGADNFANGDRVAIYDVGGMVELNYREFTVANVDTGANTFELEGVNSTSYTTFTSGGTLEKATYMIVVKSTTASQRIWGFGIDGVVLEGANKAYGGIRFSSTEKTDVGDLWVNRCRRIGITIDDSNGVLNSFFNGDYIWIGAASNSACKWARGLVLNGAIGQGVTSVNINRFNGVMQYGDAFIVGDCDNSTVAHFRGTNSGVDAGQAITGITQANPAVVTYSGADTFDNGMTIRITEVVGMTEVNNREFIVANVNTGANTFELKDVNSTGYTAYSSAGIVRHSYYGLRLLGTGREGNTRVARKTKYHWVSAWVYAEDGSKNILGTINSESTAIRTQSTAAFLHYEALDRTSGISYVSPRRVTSDRFDAYNVQNAIAHTGSPVYATTGASLARGILFDAAALELWQANFRTPQNWYEGRIYGYEIIGFPTVAAAGNVVFQFGIIHRAVGADFGTSPTMVDSSARAVSGSAAIEKHIVTLATPIAIPNPDGIILCRWGRNGASGSDTYASDYMILGINLLYQENVATSDNPDYRYEIGGY